MHWPASGNQPYELISFRVVQNLPTATALISSPSGMSTVHSLLLSQDEKWTHFSLLQKGGPQIKKFRKSFR